MNTKVLLLTVGITAIGFCVDLTVNSYSNGAGAPAGKTGSPGDGGNCTDCHSGTAMTSTNVVISSDVPGSGYVPGMVYQVGAVANHASSSKIGFQISPQNTAGTLLGALIASTDGRTQLTGGGKYITHTLAGTAAFGGTNAWNFQWTAPSSLVPVTFYGAFNATNSSNTNSGDTVYLATYTVNPDLSSVPQVKEELALEVFPTSVQDHFFISANRQLEASYSVVSVNGQLIREGKFNGVSERVEFNGISSGIYFVIVSTETSTLTSRIFKQ